jgi:hypothetical protein
MGLLERIGARRVESELPLVAPVAAEEPLFATKALGKFIATLAARGAPSVIDLGPVVGRNVSFFGEQVGCKVFIEDLAAAIDQHLRAGTEDDLPAALSSRFTQPDRSVDGVICWDLIDYLNRPSAQALADQLTRVLRPEGVLLGFFGTAQPRDAHYTKYVIEDATNLKHRPYAAERGRQAILLNRDIIRLFPGLRVSDSFLMKNNIREILFRKPAYETR